MHDPAASAISVILFGLTGLFALGASKLWIKLAEDRERPNERPSIPVAAFRSAAALTGVALGMAGVSLLWAALLALP